MKQDEDTKEHPKKEPAEKPQEKEAEESPRSEEMSPVKTFIPAADQMEEEEYPPGFKTTNIDLSTANSEHSLDDLAKEATSSTTGDGFHPQAGAVSGFHRMTEEDSAPRIRPMGSRMNGAVVSGQKNSRPSRTLPIIILGLVALGVLGATVYLLKGGSLKKAPTPTPSPQAPIVVASPSPSPSPEIQVNRSDFKIRVLNGTTKSGLAATLASKLKDLGYKIDKTGNAPSQTVVQTTIKLKASTASLSAQLIKDLAPDYEATVGANLKDTDAADGEVTIGAK
ncbi:hypothetical protein A2631_00605 [Candidatus Daviesbacteria bacterium RIFCSPHIGHO2_01_FULL_44_29]|uniref:LytR/CpsA/Psr regulator C-terminal domain-containing protein n=1 Tax=Candidatus Daviesbacteria bacterium RIFCSPHIGHO2_02_FULL_43_12 TaxID=1797776 RepID=A0A1F5KHM3_9BACT|nr:MAG: hypothetical protein A2631_00605 [Candidatus Daviesbacteria bacterium RIFCSPHIGHO2_01_FULL_44_29]OGE39435.1 MAG: hypothetical protein A3E86_01455 [Candidatus Daviesbacteria bacterium RIFCSPHIGHO2_12_FULL_47_45]OGE40334.1 MAG: hypothetical protein A3D25_03055 [Candidatus Daviesbacteria bacterium RIFCSPHIGHO2_02_FULL_43_12]OGE69747.1 MAG: hypothetical protein A3B55_02150 [Candidatus Daviesbacteria bacterium RIFCSPLOWO2_01_FULL_43_15]